MADAYEISRKLSQTLGSAALLGLVACHTTLPVVDDDPQSDAEKTDKADDGLGSNLSLTAPSAKKVKICNAPNKPKIIYSSETTHFARFKLFGGDLFFYENQSDVGVAAGATLMKIAGGRGAPSVLYQAEEGQTADTLAVDETGVYIALSGAGVPAPQIYRVPLTGGAPEPLADQSFSYRARPSIETSDRDFLYVSHMNSLLRVAKASGAVTQITSTIDLISPVLLHRDTLWFGLGEVYTYKVASVPASASNAMSTQYSSTGCGAGLAVNDAGVFCGEKSWPLLSEGGSTTSADRTLGYGFYEVDFLRMSAPFGDKVFASVIGNYHSEILEFNPVTWEQRALECEISAREMQANETDLFWTWTEADGRLDTPDTSFMGRVSR